MTQVQEDRLIKRMETLLRYKKENSPYRMNGELHPKVKKQLYSIIDTCKKEG